MRLVTCKLLTIFIFFGLLAHSHADILPPQASATADAFANLIDRGELETAYNSASPLLQISQEQQEWISEISRLRQLLGPVQQRTLKAVRVVSTFPQLPDGDYLVIQYETRMQHKQQAAEIILLKKQQANWVVCSYAIR